MAKSVKEQLIKQLALGQFISGQVIGEELGISRAAVSKHIRGLQDMGLDVFCVSGKGYRFSQPLRLLDKLCCLYNYVEMARVTGTPFNFLLFRGQSIKVVSQILRKARLENYIVPAKKPDATDDKFEGATVLTPKTDYYKV